jgi:demethylmenaquinone methyltransferase/2-methoxy-6-polyprenyl-1,4-benzoquinol methylase
MKTEDLGNLKILNILFKPAGIMMESRLRKLLMNPARTLKGAGIQRGQIVLEVGCGTGFFTIPAAQMIGDQGRLVAMDVLLRYIDRVSDKVQAADLKNVQVVKRDALDTGLDAASIDTVLLFGVLPFPFLPLDRLLPEMHRVLKTEGTMSVWLFPISGLVPRWILKSGLFVFVAKRNGVYNYRPRLAEGD